MIDYTVKVTAVEIPANSVFGIQPSHHPETGELCIKVFSENGHYYAPVICDEETEKLIESRPFERQRQIRYTKSALRDLRVEYAIGLIESPNG